MIYRHLLLVAVGLLLSLEANATNILILTPPPQVGPVLVGDTAELLLSMDFTDITLGGGVRIDIADPSKVSLVSIDFDPLFSVDDADFRCPTDPGASNPVNCPSGPGDESFVSFGNFNGLTGQHTVARITLMVDMPTGAQGVDIGLEIASTFFDVGGPPLTVMTTGTNIVPEPGTLALVGCGILGLAFAGRRRRS